VACTSTKCGLRVQESCPLPAGASIFGICRPSSTSLGTTHAYSLAEARWGIHGVMLREPWPTESRWRPVCLLVTAVMTCHVTAPTLFGQNSSLARSWLQQRTCGSRSSSIIKPLTRSKAQIGGWGVAQGRKWPGRGPDPRLKSPNCYIFPRLGGRHTLQQQIFRKPVQVRSEIFQHWGACLDFNDSTHTPLLEPPPPPQNLPF
jgi:hypothetical protein